MRGVFRLGGIFAIGLPLIFAAAAGAQPTTTSGPSSPGGTSPSTTAPATPGTSTSPGAPASTEPMPPLGPTSQDQSEQETTALQKRLVTIRRNRHDQLERRGPYEGYVTPWSGPYIIEKKYDDVSFLVQGAWVRTMAPCWGWRVSDRVRFEWGPEGGACMLYNRTRHRACPVSCWPFPAWHKWY